MINEFAHINSQDQEVSCAIMHSQNWGDLEYVFAVAQGGSVSAAARALGVSHTTVMRRVKAFEEQLDEPIFEHRASGYRLTAKGEMYLEAAQNIDATLADLQRKVAGGDDSLSGTVTITTTDSIFPPLVPHLKAFRAIYPDVRLEVFMTNRRLDLFNRDADIAIRPSDNPPGELVGRRCAELHFGIYATAELSRGLAPDAPFDTLPWLALADPLMSSVPGRWQERTLDTSAMIARADSFKSLLDLAEAGMGLAILPCHLGEPSTVLNRVFRHRVDLHVDLWVLSHRDVLRSSRVRACNDFLYEGLKAERRLFHGGPAATYPQSHSKQLGSR